MVEPVVTMLERKKCALEEKHPVVGPTFFRKPSQSCALFCIVCVVKRISEITPAAAAGAAVGDR